MPYLTAVGELKQYSNNIDLQYAWSQIGKTATAGVSGDAALALADTLALKQTLLLRPIERLLSEPACAQWLAQRQQGLLHNYRRRGQLE